MVVVQREGQRLTSDAFLYWSLLDSSETGSLTEPGARQLDWQAGELQVLGTQMCTARPTLPPSGASQGSEPRSSHFLGEHFLHWAISPWCSLWACLNLWEMSAIIPGLQSQVTTEIFFFCSELNEEPQVSSIPRMPSLGWYGHSPLDISPCPGLHLCEELCGENGPCLHAWPLINISAPTSEAIFQVQSERPCPGQSP